MGNSIPTDLALNAPTQILSRGNTALSIMMCYIFSFAKNIEVLAPAEPAPAISTSAVKSGKLFNGEMLFQLAKKIF